MVIALEEKIKKVDKPFEMKGNYIGEYVEAKPEIRYKYEMSISPLGVSGGKFFASTRKTIMKFILEKSLRKEIEERKGVYVKINEEKSPYTFTNYKSPVYKPYIEEEIKEENFQGPFTQCDNPIIEKIICKNKKIYFGIINNKLVMYSVAYGKNREKQMILHDIKKIKKNQSNREYLKKIANKTLFEIMERARIDYNRNNKVDAFCINWPNLRNFSYVAKAA